MAQIFSKSADKWIYYILSVLFAGALFTAFFFWYFGSPKYTDIGYRPKQPVDYSHKLHAGDLGMDCRYCHTSVEISAKAGIPPTQTCMNCHNVVGRDSEKLLKVRESWASGKPLEWIRIHDLPDYAYFNHSVHINAGVGCESCHGNVRNMEVVEQKETLSMGWCLDCHRAPEMQLRPERDITKMNWKPPSDQLKFAARIMEEKKIAPPIECSGCHR